MILFCRAARCTTPAPELWNFATLPLRMANCCPRQKPERGGCRDRDGCDRSDRIPRSDRHALPCLPGIPLPDAGFSAYHQRGRIHVPRRCYHCGGRRYHRLAQLWRFQGNVIDATKVRVLAFIDMAAKGMHYPPSEQAVADINPEITAAVANTWSDVIVGVKSAHYWAKHEDADHPIWASIDGAIKAASMSGKIVMVDSIPMCRNAATRTSWPACAQAMYTPCVCAAVPPDGRKRQDAALYAGRTGARRSL